MGLRDLLLWLFTGRPLPRKSDPSITEADFGGDVSHREPVVDEVELAKLVEAAFPFEVVTAAGAVAEAERQSLAAKPGRCAAHLGDRDNFLTLASIFHTPTSGIQNLRSPSDIVMASADIDLAAFSKTPVGIDASDLPDLMKEISGAWPAEAEALNGPLAVTSPLTNQPHSLTYIGVFPTDDETEIPALLRWGAWNDCPAPEVHVAHLRGWRDAYGAKLVSITRDTIELRVDRRPASREEALELARQHFAYCPDIVLQGTQTIEALAASLMQSDWWFFWWD
ncbi:DUF4253 domain-containing protein [Maricaulis sp.]|uniref:DUF4253 domain-containing protein n=1 Tax=Maricaulis sp. TaxID=1486257 RepID=UPI002B26C479|nr:DUF4253 domain-containing protein [Maricaulis sp.]